MIAFIKKEFIHIFRDRRTMLILFGMPIAMVLLFGFAITNDVKNITVAFLDKSKDNKSIELSTKIVASEYFNMAGNLKNEKEIESAFQTGEVKAVVLFGEKFAEKLQTGKGANIELILDASDPNTASLISSYLKAIIGSYLLENFGEKAKNLTLISVENRMIYNSELKSVYMFVPGIMAVLLMLISTMMTSISLAREKELGTMEILLASPLKPMQIIIGKVTPYVLMALIINMIILVLALTVFDMPMYGNYLLLLGESLLFIILALMLGLFISTISDTQQTAMLISMGGLLLPTILLSGFIFPIKNMPLVLQYFSHIIPSKWFIIVVKNIMLKGVGLSYCWLETTIMLAMTIFFLLLSIKKFKIRLQ